MLRAHSHVVTGWSICTDPKTKQMVYDIYFTRLSSEVSMDVVLRRPFADEVEDYKEYKRLRHVSRDPQEGSELKLNSALSISSDGTVDTLQEERRPQETTCIS